jgi:DNA-binding NtrC family response regulator
MNGVESRPLQRIANVGPQLHIPDRVDLDAETALDLAVAGRSLVNVLVTAADTVQRAAWARTIHAHSAHSQGPFVVPLPGNTREASTRDVDDWFVRAAGGTMFIDHIAELSAHVQAVLLFRLTDQVYRARELAMADRRVRIIAGSDRSLRADLSAGTFSEELFYRLNVIHIHPPLAREG